MSIIQNLLIFSAFCILHSITKVAILDHASKLPETEVVRVKRQNCGCCLCSTPGTSCVCSSSCSCGYGGNNNAGGYNPGLGYGIYGSNMPGLSNYGINYNTGLGCGAGTNCGYNAAGYNNLQAFGYSAGNGAYGNLGTGYGYPQAATTGIACCGK